MVQIHEQRVVSQAHARSSKLVNNTVSQEHDI